MTDLSHHALFAAPIREIGWPWPLPYACVFVAGATGLLAGHAMGGNAGAFESTLLLLLRFMAAMKFLAVLGAAGAVHWRLMAPIEGRLGAAYGAALLVMAVAPGLIWSLGGIALGALLFHVGLLTFLYLAWKDDGYRLKRRG